MSESFFYPMFSGMYAWMNALLIWAIFTFTFFIALKKNKWAVMDTAWGLGFVASSWLGLLAFQGAGSILHLVPTVLITLWGVRLAWHLTIRNARLAEDPRYVSIKKGYQNKNLFLAYIQVFLLQGLIMWVMCIPLYFYMTLPLPPSTPALIFVVFGTLTCLKGLFWEWTADSQLKHFIKTEKKLHPNRAITSGLWRSSRHPNYFGEIVFWFGIWLISLASFSRLEDTSTWFIQSIIALISPLTICYIIAKVTGPMLEAHMSKYENWDEVQRIPYIFPNVCLLFSKKK